MGLRFRDLMMNVTVECMPGPALPGCACTQTANAPACTKGSQNPKPAPKPPRPGGPRPPKKAEGLEQLRHQLQHQLRAQDVRLT